MVWNPILVVEPSQNGTEREIDKHVVSKQRKNYTPAQAEKNSNAASSFCIALACMRMLHRCLHLLVLLRLLLLLPPLPRLLFFSLLLISNNLKEEKNLLSHLHSMWGIRIDLFYILISFCHAFVNLTRVGSATNGYGHAHRAH